MIEFLGRFATDSGQNYYELYGKIPSDRMISRSDVIIAFNSTATYCRPFFHFTDYSPITVLPGKLTLQIQYSSKCRYDTTSRYLIEYSTNGINLYDVLHDYKNTISLPQAQFIRACHDRFYYLDIDGILTQYGGSKIFSTQYSLYGSLDGVFSAYRDGEFVQSSYDGKITRTLIDKTPEQIGFSFYKGMDNKLYDLANKVIFDPECFCDITILPNNLVGLKFKYQQIINKSLVKYGWVIKNEGLTDYIISKI